MDDFKVRIESVDGDKCEIPPTPVAQWLIIYPVLFDSGFGRITNIKLSSF